MKASERLGTTDATILAAMALLHRELDRAGEVRLTQADIESFQSEATTTRIEWAYDEATGDVLLRHNRPGKHDA